MRHHTRICCTQALLQHLCACIYCATTDTAICALSFLSLLALQGDKLYKSQTQQSDQQQWVQQQYISIYIDAYSISVFAAFIVATSDFQLCHTCVLLVRICFYNLLSIFFFLFSS